MSVGPRLALGGEPLLPGKIRSQIRDLLVGKRLSYRAHDRVVSSSVAILGRCVHEIAVLLTGKARNLRRDRLVAFRTVACSAGHSRLPFFGVVIRQRGARAQERGAESRERKRMYKRRWLRCGVH